MRVFPSTVPTVPVRLLLLLGATLPACGASPIRVNGVVKESPEMRPLQNVQADAYKQLRVLVRPAAEPSGSEECGFTPLEGSSEGDNKKNAACVPADATNDTVRLVRQRLRGYGVQVVRDATEPYDYTLQVRLTGDAPRTPDPLLARVVVRLSFTLRSDSAISGFFKDIDMAAAAAAFRTAARDCGVREAELTAFATATTQPMNPQFDIAAVTADAVDATLGCAEIGRFFRDAHTRFAQHAAAPP